jgi:hypothetical protein
VEIVFQQPTARLLITFFGKIKVEETSGIIDSGFYCPFFI